MSDLATSPTSQKVSVPALTSLTAHSPGGTLSMSPWGEMHIVAATGLPLVFSTSTAHTASSTWSKNCRKNMHANSKACLKQELRPCSCMPLHTCEVVVYSHVQTCIIYAVTEIELCHMVLQSTKISAKQIILCYSTIIQIWILQQKAKNSNMDSSHISDTEEYK